MSNIANTTKALILANPTMKNAEILVELRKVHPEKSSVACIAWYKSAMKPNTKTGKKQVQVELSKEEQIEALKKQIQELTAKREELEMSLMVAQEETVEG